MDFVRFSLHARDTNLIGTDYIAVLDTVELANLLPGDGVALAGYGGNGV